MSENNVDTTVNDTDQTQEIEKVKKIDPLTELVTLPGQKFVGISFLVDKGKATYQVVTKERSDGKKVTKYQAEELVYDESYKRSMTGVRIAFFADDFEEATKLADKFREQDPAFDIYVGEVGKWLPFNPNPYDEKSVKGVKYADGNEELEQVMIADKKNKEQTVIYNNKRMTTDKLQMAQEQLKDRKKQQKKLKKSQKENKDIDYSTQLKEINDEIERVEKEAKELSERDQELLEKLRNFNQEKKPNLRRPKNY